MTNADISTFTLNKAAGRSIEREREREVAFSPVSPAARGGSYTRFFILCVKKSLKLVERVRD